MSQQFEGVVMAHTPSAVLVDIDGLEVWLPRSQCQFDPEEIEKDDDVIVEVPDWLAKAKGLS